MFILRILLYILAAVCVLAAAFMLLRALGARLSAGRKVFGVERQAELQRMKLSTVLGIFLFIFGLLFLGGGTLLGGGDEAAVADTETSTPAEGEETKAASGGVEIPLSELAATATSEIVVATPTAPAVILPTNTAVPTVMEPTPEPEQTDTPEPTVALTTAVVNSPIVGLYLRQVPGGEILERLEDQAVVTLQGEEQIVDGVEWARVVAASGNEGWVASDFLDLGSQDSSGNGG